MASSMIISKRVPAKLILPCLQSLVSPVTMRSFSTSAEREYSDDRSMEIDRRSDQSPVSRRRDSPSLFGDVFDPFIQSSRSLSQILNMMDQMMESPFAAAWRGMGGRTGWDVKEDENALYLRIDMPGLTREQVKVSAEQNTLIIKGEGEAESGEEEGGRKYSSRIDLPEKLYKVEDIRAEMKNGVLKVVVPKVKEDERKDVFQIKVD